MTFLTEFKKVFDHPTAGQDVGARLTSLHQGNRTVAAYSTEFRTLAAGSGWNDTALRSTFRQGLSEGIKDELVRDKPSTLDDLVSLAIEVDERIQERRRERGASPTHLPAPCLQCSLAIPTRQLTWSRWSPPPPLGRSPCRWEGPD